MSAVIRSCGCASTKTGNPAGAEFQDRQYGKGRRVHNVGAKVVRCTICGSEKSLDNEAEKPKAKAA
jgi:hypothetical protein